MGSNGDLDAGYMREALELATGGLGRTSPNPMVGAVVVRDGRVVGRGYHGFFGGPHAEVNALAEAGRDAEGATIYVTLEPCCVSGNTPPCTDAILEAGVARVVAPVLDPNPAVSGRGAALLRDAGLRVDVGLLADEARGLNAPYFKYRETGLPLVTLKLALSLDGRITAPPGGPRWTSSDESRALVHRMRSESDCVLVGIGTALADDPELTDRRPDSPGTQPARAVLDCRLRLPGDSKIARSASRVKSLVVCGPGADEARRKALEATGVSVVEAPATEGRLDLKSALKVVADRGCISVLCEGGAAVAASLMSEGLVDRVAFFVAPKVYGSGGLPAFGGLEGSWWSSAEAFENARWTSVGGDALFLADVRRQSGSQAASPAVAD